MGLNTKSLLSESQRLRILELNREMLRVESHPPLPLPPPLKLTLDHVAPGKEIEAEGCPVYSIRQSLRQLHPESSSTVDRFQFLFDRGGVRSHESWSKPLLSMARSDPRHLLFMDIESCGFAGRAIFLIGTMRFTGDDFQYELILARDYQQEAGMLRRYAQLIDSETILVTFNGRTFDVPALQERAAVHRTALPQPMTHCDLLIESRSRWKKELPNCKLQTLEVMLCRRRRSGDVSGSIIPQVYHQFVRTGRAGVLAQVLHHNRLDLWTLADLGAILLSGCDPLAVAS